MWHTHTYNHTKTGFGLTGLAKHQPHTTTSTHTLPPAPTPSKTNPLEATRPPPFLPGPSFLPLTLCGLSCMLTVPKHDEPFSPMGISPPSKLASATSVSVSQSRCNGSSSTGSSVAVAVTWLRRQPASQWHSASTWLRGGTLHPAQLRLGGKVLSRPLSLAPEQILLIYEWLSKDALQLEDTFLIWTHGGCVGRLRGNAMLCSAPLEQGWLKPSGVHPPPALRPLSPLPLCSPLACEGQVSRISHPPQSSPQLCCDPVPRCHTWPEGFPGKTKGLTMNFAPTRRHSPPLNRKTVRSELIWS